MKLFTHIITEQQAKDWGFKPYFDVFDTNTETSAKDVMIEELFPNQGDDMDNLLIIIIKQKCKHMNTWINWAEEIECKDCKTTIEIMAVFKIKETEKVMMAYIYKVEAETKEQALEKYINELAGTLGEVNSYVTDDEKEDIVVLD